MKVDIVQPFTRCPSCEHTYGQEHHCTPDFAPWNNSDLTQCKNCRSWVVASEEDKHAELCYRHGLGNIVNQRNRSYVEDHIVQEIAEIDTIVGMSNPAIPVTISIDFTLPSAVHLGSIRLLGRGRTVYEAIDDAYRASKLLSETLK